MGLSPKRILAEGTSDGRGEKRRTHDANGTTAIVEQGAAGSAANLCHGSASVSQRKRKNGGLDLSSLQDEEILKKAKLTIGEADDVRSESGSCPDISRRLPAEIWHHIFSFSTPRSLGRLLLVNKLFHQYLNPTSRVETSPPVLTTSTPSTLPVLKPDAIWQASRRLHWPRMPAPLKGRSELEMWRLACSQTCQFCKRKDRNEPVSQGLPNWYPGPGAKGVSPVFAFFVVSCGQCLSERSTKEIDIATSSSIPYFLLSSLPMIFLSSELHVMSLQAIRAGLPLPIHLTKMYWPEHLDKAKADLEAVLKLGPAAGEEWGKGLDTKGKGILADVSRWEKWYHSGGVHQMRSSEYANSHSSAKETPVAGPSAKATGLAKPKKQLVVINGQEQANKKAGLSGIPQKPQAGSQHQKNLAAEEAMKLKTKRRIEIVKRASQLKPPIMPRDLIHIPAFRDALQTISPLDDNAWELLKSRLLAQLRTVVKRGKDNLTSREATDEEWHLAQGPCQARIAEHADKIIRDNWSSGSSVNKNNCSEFAVEVLLQVRKRFYDQVIEEAMVAIASGSEPVTDPLGGPWTQKLTLETMRGLFEAKIKPHIDPSCKGLFLCSACEKSAKEFPIESVIQHFAAKHTRALSKQNVVVNWRAEWPEHPIFTSDAIVSAKQIPTTATAASSSDFIPDSKLLQTSSNAVAPSQTHQPVALPNHRLDVHEGTSDRAEGDDSRNNNLNRSLYPYFYSRIKPQARYNHVSPSDPYRLGVDFMANIAKNVWKNLSSIPSIAASVKMCTIIHHIAKDFQQKYSEPAPFEMFRDGIANHESFAPLRTVPNLTCRVCMSSSGSQKRTSLVGLVDHFNQAHGKRLIEQNMPPDDWRADMIWLPNLGALEGLEMALRKKKSALRLVCDALPWAFKGKALAEDEDEGGKEEGELVEAQESKLPLQPDGQANTTTRAKDPPSITTITTSTPALQQSQPPREPRVIDDRPLLRPASVVYGSNTRFQTANTPSHQQASGSVQGASKGQALTNQESRSAVAKVTAPTKVLDGQSQPSNSKQHASMPGAGQSDRLNQGSARQDRQEAVKFEPDRDLDEVEFIESRRVVRDRRGRSTSPRPVHGHEQPMFRQRSPRPTAYTQMPREYRGSYPAHPVPPFAMYELYEMQDHRGDYVVRRPIRAEEHEMVTYVPQNRRDNTWYPYYATSHEYAPPGRQHALYGGERPHPAGANSTEYADYDPRHPATGSFREGSGHHARRP